MTGPPPKVFISCSHEVTHQERVLDLADQLRAGGIDAEIDQYNDAPAEGWPRWCERQIEAADVVLMVLASSAPPGLLCTPEFFSSCELTVN